ncbi:MAG: CaiB/BaiF CoA transferase family protein [Gammaproteobacteria bacterium]
MTGDAILEGIRVLDFSRYIAGPYCAQLLGFLGADVVRVDKPGGGEDRFVGPVGEDVSAVFLKTGCNKRSMTLDLKHERAPEVIGRLVAGADVVIVNMPPKVLARMGLDYATLSAIRPDIILTTQTCFGHEGPWADRGGFDGIGQVMSGSAYMSGTAGSPRRCATPYVDYSTAVLGAFGTLAALYQRRDTGRGQHVQAALLGSAIAAFSAPLIEQAVLGIDRPPLGNRGQTSAPTDIFASRDGHIITQVVGNGLFRRLAKVVGHPEWVEDPRFATDEMRGEARDEICDAVAAWVAGRTTEEAVEAIAGAGVPCGPVLDLDAALEHPQVQAMGYMQAVDYPGLDQAAPVARLPLDFSAFSPEQRRPPQVGEHTDAVLAEAGYAADAIAGLRAEGVV